MTLSLSQIESIASEARPDLESYMNCNPINPTIQTALENNGITVKNIEGTVSTGRSHIGGEEHLYLLIPETEVSDSSSDVIVDGAIQQFCDELYNDCIFVTFGSKQTLPKVAVLTSNSELYEYYYKEQTY